MCMDKNMKGKFRRPFTILVQSYQKPVSSQSSDAGVSALIICQRSKEDNIMISPVEVQTFLSLTLLSSEFGRL